MWVVVVMVTLLEGVDILVGSLLWITSVGDFSVEGCGYLAMGPQPSVVGKGGLSEEERAGSRRQNKAEEEEENTRPGSRKRRRNEFCLCGCFKPLLK